MGSGGANHSELRINRFGYFGVWSCFYEALRLKPGCVLFRRDGSCDLSDGPAGSWALNRRLRDTTSTWGISFFCLFEKGEKQNPNDVIQTPSPPPVKPLKFIVGGRLAGWGGTGGGEGRWLGRRTPTRSNRPGWN